MSRMPPKLFVAWRRMALLAHHPMIFEGRLVCMGCGAAPPAEPTEEGKK